MVETYQPLYLKYRPQSLLELVGQSSVVQTLKNGIEHERICHAYLFTGPRGCGKTSSARILAKSLNCVKGMTAEPCLECTSCLEIKLSNSPAVIEIDAASNNSVDDARLLIERAPLVAQGARKKIYIIDECHMLTKEAFNALLKTIEEPPPNVVFILATTEEHKVPPTIVSRCQRLMFRLVNQKELVPHLRSVAQREGFELENEAYELIARRSGGGLRDALGLLDQASLLWQPGKPVTVPELLTMLGAVHEDVLLRISAGVLERDGQSVLECAHGLMMDGREPALLALELAKHFLNLAKAGYLAAGKGSVETQSLILGSANYIKGLIEQAPKFDRAELAQIVEQLDALEQACRRSSQPALNLEVGLVALCHRHDILVVKELAERVAVLEAELFDGANPNAVRKAAPAVAARPTPQPAARPQPVSTAGANLGAAAFNAAVSAQSSSGSSASPANAAYAAVSANAPSAPPAVSNVAPNMPPASPASASANQPSHEPGVADAASSKPAAAPTAQSARVADDVSQENPALEVEDAYDDNQPASAPVAANAQEPAVVSAGNGNGRREILEGPEPEDDGMDMPQYTAPAPQPVASGSSPFMLEELWSNLLDELQRTHIPTFSLVSSHAFIVGMEEDSLIIGVKAENMQKMLENKAAHLKTASTKTAGRPVHVKIKVVAQQGAGRSPQPPKSRAPESTGAAGDDSQRAMTPARTSSGGGGTAVAERPPQTQTQSAPAGVETQAPTKLSPSPRPSAPALDAPPDSGLVQLAYKIFEGPGSRLIT